MGVWFVLQRHGLCADLFYCFIETVRFTCMYFVSNDEIKIVNQIDTIHIMPVIMYVCGCVQYALCLCYRTYQLRWYFLAAPSPSLITAMNWITTTEYWTWYPGRHITTWDGGVAGLQRAVGLRDSPHDDVIKWKHFPRYWPFVWGIHRSRWIPHTKASDAELWCFLWSE